MEIPKILRTAILPWLAVALVCGAGAAPKLAGEPPVRVFLAGDSTMAPKPPPPGNPERGWGEALEFFFDEGVQVVNCALNGRSTLSFRTEGHWTRLLDDLRAGDWVIIQFGHNDSKESDPSRYAAPQTAYRANLECFIDEVRERDAHPILATPIVRRKFLESGELIATHGDYPAVVREVAAATNVPLLDLQKTTWAEVQEMGVEASKEVYLWVPGGHFARFPDGRKDNTHLTLKGASLVAQMAAEGILGLDLPLGKRLKKPMPEIDEIVWERIYPQGFLPPAAQGVEEFTEDGRVHAVSDPSLGVFRSTIGEGPRPAVVIAPGGGYARLAIEHEGHDIARWFNALGIDAFVLKYRMKEFGYPAPLQDVTRAIRFLRGSAKKRGIDPDRIGVIGFSAGGHVAGMAATLWDSDDAKAGDSLDAVAARPDFAAMIYPVVTMKERFAHPGSRENLLGNEPGREAIEALSLETRVRRDSPPVFLAHSAADPAVPAENSLHFAEALRAREVPVALHLFARGPHGFGMRPGHGEASEWPRLLAGWLVGQAVIPGES